MKTPLALLLLASPALPQSFNVDVNAALGTPSNAYGAAAGQAGFWNSVDPAGPTFSPAPVNGLAGTGTTVTLEFNDNVPQGFSFDNPLTGGDDAALLDDFDDVGSFSTAKVKYTFANLQNGFYDVFVYAWAADDPINFLSVVEVIDGSKGLQNCGGADWTGSHVEGITYVRDQVQVVAGELKLRVNFGAGAATVNGFQIVYQGAGCGSNPVNYCTAGISASGCQATLSSSGNSSATAPSGFVLTASGVEGDKDGLFFQGTNGRQTNTWGNGTSFQCVVPPVKRLGILSKQGTINACNGSFTQDVNAYWTAFPLKNPGPGAVVQAQCWYRDPQNTSNQTTSLSNAIEWTVCP
jgi:hypothetical protein